MRGTEKSISEKSCLHLSLELIPKCVFIQRDSSFPEWLRNSNFSSMPVGVEIEYLLIFGNPFVKYFVKLTKDVALSTTQIEGKRKKTEGNRK